jgi:hypothetical protein
MTALLNFLRLIQLLNSPRSKLSILVSHLWIINLQTPQIHPQTISKVSGEGRTTTFTFLVLEVVVKGFWSSRMSKLAKL